MRAHEVRLDILQVPLRSRLASAAGEWGAVPLGLLHLVTDDGLEGLGEVEFTQGPVVGANAAEELLTRWCEGLGGLELGDEEAVAARVAEMDRRGGRGRPADGPLARALAAAVGTAIVDVSARAAGRPLAEHLCRARFGGAPLRFLACPPSARVAVNGLLGMGEPRVVAEEARALVEAGFPCLKLKAGAEAPGAVRERVAAVRDAVGPVVGLRLDLNGALDEAGAAEVLEELAPFYLEYVEQPVPVEAGAVALARLRRRASVPIAADEAVTNLAAVRELAQLGAVDAIVVKPSRVGGLAEAARIVELALSCDTRVTIATMVESGVGVAAALHLAAAVPGGTHGLSTGSLLADDLVGGAMVPRLGRLTLPSAAGLGVGLDGGAVEAFRIARSIASRPAAHA